MSHVFTMGMLVGAVVVENEVNVPPGRQAQALPLAFGLPMIAKKRGILAALYLQPDWRWCRKCDRLRKTIR